MEIKYSKLLSAYIVMKHKKYGRSMLACDNNLFRALKKAITRYNQQ